MKFSIIAAADSQWGLSREGKLPWSDTDYGRADMKFFRQMTMITPYNKDDQNIYSAVIMGRKTFESLGGKPLLHRMNIVLSRGGMPGHYQNEGVECMPHLDTALEFCKAQKYRSVWVIGGAEIYAIALQHPLLDMVYINRIPDRNDWVYKPEKGYRCDVFFPAHLLQALEKLEKPTCNVVYPRYLEQYSAANKDEHAYLGLLGQLMSRPQTPNRTGIDTHGMFAQQLRFQLYHPLRGAIMPLLTTKKMSYKLVLSELLWFLNGRRCTNTKYLHQFDNKIWDCNTTREFLDSRGLTEARGYQAGDTGPIYGFQWRHWGGDTAERSGDTAERSGDTAERSGDTAERSGDTAATGNAATPPDGIDQLAEVIKTLRTDPYSRRMIVSAWNVAQLGDMALPPCHWSFQFHTEHVVPIYGDVDEPHPDDLLNPYGLVEFHDQIPRKDIRPYMFRLNCCMNMRSADMALGVPFNIASYATLVHIVARIVGMIPGELTINMTDCHLYHNHLEGVREQIERAPYRFPLFRFGPEISAKENLDLDDFTSEDPKFLDQFRILGYHSHPAIKYPMAV